MNIYQELLPESYLLILADAPDPADEARLADALRQAGRSGRPGIWVDCSQLPHLLPSALQVLLRYYRRLRRLHIPLVLCHLSERAGQQLAHLAPEQCPPVVPSLLDAERYCADLRLEQPLPGGL